MPQASLVQTNPERRMHWSRDGSTLTVKSRLDRTGPSVLHNDKGPAIVFSDGRPPVYALGGQAMPREEWEADPRVVSRGSPAAAPPVDLPERYASKDSLSDALRERARKAMDEDFAALVGRVRPSDHLARIDEADARLAEVEADARMLDRLDQAYGDYRHEIRRLDAAARSMLAARGKEHFRRYSADEKEFGVVPAVRRLLDEGVLGKVSLLDRLRGRSVAAEDVEDLKASLADAERCMDRFARACRDAGMADAAGSREAHAAAGKASFERLAAATAPSGHGKLLGSKDEFRRLTELRKDLEEEARHVLRQVAPHEIALLAECGGPDAESLRRLARAAGFALPDARFAEPVRPAAAPATPWQAAGSFGQAESVRVIIDASYPARALKGGALLRETLMEALAAAGIQSAFRDDWLAPPKADQWALGIDPRNTINERVSGRSGVILWSPEMTGPDADTQVAHVLDALSAAGFELSNEPTATIGALPHGVPDLGAVVRDLLGKEAARDPSSPQGRFKDISDLPGDVSHAGKQVGPDGLETFREDMQRSGEPFLVWRSSRLPDADLANRSKLGIAYAAALPERAASYLRGGRETTSNSFSMLGGGFGFLTAYAASWDPGRPFSDRGNIDFIEARMGDMQQVDVEMATGRADHRAGTWLVVPADPDGLTTRRLAIPWDTVRSDYPRHAEAIEQATAFLSWSRETRIPPTVPFDPGTGTGSPAPAVGVVPVADAATGGRLRTWVQEKWDGARMSPVVQGFRQGAPEASRAAAAELESRRRMMAAALDGERMPEPGPEKEAVYAR